MIQNKVIPAKEAAENIIAARESFREFVYRIFALSFDHFIGGEYIDDVCELYDRYRNVARVSARDHFKSTGLYACVMYDILLWDGDLEGHYFSFQEGMAGYHIGKIKSMIARNPYYDEIVDEKPNSQSTMMYNRSGFKFTMEPHGMLAFKRGIHADRIYVDDPFQDPENKLIPTVIKKINDVFVTQIMDMPKDTGRLHVSGTPQTTFDFFFQPNVMQSFAVMVKPAVLSYKKKIALWPEHMDFETLMRKKSERGTKIFNQEYMCSPAYSENSYFKEKQIQDITDEALPNLKLTDKMDTWNPVVAGLDVGKKAHPSHFVVYEIRDGKKAVQIHSKWMDGWDYTRGKGPKGEILPFDPSKPTQIEYVRECINAFQIDKVEYDSTRGEFETLLEQKILPEQMEGINFTSKMKFALAANFDKYVSDDRIRMIDDARQSEQIVMVTNDLQAMETPNGHGDSFWSNALALDAAEKVAPNLRNFYNSDGKPIDSADEEEPETAGLLDKKF